MPKQWTAAGSADSIGEQLSIVKFVQWLMSAPIHRLVRLSDRIDHDSNRGVFAGVVGSTSVRRFLGATTSMASPCMRTHHRICSPLMTVADTLTRPSSCLLMCWSADNGVSLSRL